MDPAPREDSGGERRWVEDVDRLLYFPYPIFYPEWIGDEFFIREDLAEHFGHDYNAEAVARILEHLRMRPIEGLNPEKDISWESGAVSIRTRSPDAILAMAELINDLSLEDRQVPVPPPVREEIRARLREVAQRPPPPRQLGE